MHNSKYKKMFNTIKNFMIGLYISFLVVMLIYSLLDSLKIIKNDFYVIVYGIIALIFVIIVSYYLLKHEKVRQITQKIFTVFAVIITSLAVIKTFIPRLTVDFIRDAATKAETKDIKANDWLAYFGSIYGAFIGAVLSVTGAVIVTLILNKIQQSKDNKEQLQLTKAIIDYFIIDDINYNFDRMDEEYESFLKCFEKEYVEFKKCKSYKLYDFRFDNFDEVKHELIKSSSPIIIETLEKYRLFRLVKSIRPSETDENTYNQIKKLMKKHYKK